MSAIPILVAEDHSMTFEVIREILESQGYIVTWAEDGVTAVEMARSGEYELLLLDMRMPEMDGEQVAEALHESGPPGLRIVAMSASDTQSLRERLGELGVRTLVRKPFSARELLEALEPLVKAS